MKTMLKKVLLLAFILGCGMQISALSETEDKYSTYKEYSYVLLDDGTIKITRYNGNEKFIEIPESVDGYSITSIGDYAFGGRSSLSSITLPDTIVEIGANPFYGCSSLEKVNVSPDHPVLAIIDGLLYYKPDKRLVYCPTYKEKVTIPDGIQSIGDSAFSYCDNLSSITLPDSIKSTGDGAFSYCDNLSSITLPDSVTSIGDRAFYRCSSLSSITLPDSITSIGDNAFLYCYNLSSITLPDSITSIGNNAFYGCSSLTITVSRDSYAAQYCKKNSLQYTYTDSLDWLN